MNADLELKRLNDNEEVLTWFRGEYFEKFNRPILTSYEDKKRILDLLAHYSKDQLLQLVHDFFKFSRFGLDASKYTVESFKTAFSKTKNEAIAKTTPSLRILTTYSCVNKHRYQVELDPCEAEKPHPCPHCKT